MGNRPSRAMRKKDMVFPHSVQPASVGPPGLTLAPGVMLLTNLQFALQRAIQFSPPV